MSIEQFKETLRKLCIHVEDLSIENGVYFDAILESRTINLSELKERVADAQLDPEKRKEVHQMYSGMWKSIESSGIDALFEELLNNLPPSDMPN